MNKSFSIAVAAVLAAALALSGCVRPTPSTGVLEVPDGVSKIVSAMSHARTFRFNSTLSDNYTVIQTTGNSTDTWLWQGRTEADLARKAAHVSMNITDLAHTLVTQYRWEMYLDSGWQYYNQTTPGGGVGNPWTRTQLESQGPLFSNSAQVTPLIELLTTATQVDTVGSEVVDGIDCEILEAIPTAAGASDWVLSQDRESSGPSIGWWRAGPKRSKEIYANAFISGVARLWIDRNSHRILKTDVSLHFSVLPGNAVRSDTPLEGNGSETDLGFDEIDRDFHGEMRFFDYGQPLSIVPPREAVKAPTHP